MAEAEAAALSSARQAGTPGPVGRVEGAVRITPMVPDPSRPWRLFALLVVVLAIGCVATSVVLQLVHQMIPDPATYWVADVVCVVLYGIATLLMLPRTRHPAAWLMLLVTVGCGVSALATQYHRLEIQHPGAPDGDLLWFSAMPLWILGTYSTFAILPWLVSVGPLRPEARFVAALAAATVSVSALSALTMEMKGFYTNPYVVAWDPWQDLLLSTFMWPDRLCYALGVLGLVRLVMIWRRRGAAERGWGWLVVGQVLLLLAMLPVVFVGFEPTDLELELSGASLLAAQAFLPVALLVVVLGQRLWGIDATVNRLAVWSLLTGVVVALYVAVVWLTLRLLPVSDQTAGLLAALTLALVAHPARVQLQRRVDRMVYGAHSDPASLLTSLGEQLRQGRAAGALPALVESLRGGLRLGSVQVASLEHPEVFAAAGAEPAPTADLVVLPLVIDRRHVGDLTLTAPVGQRLDPRTVRVVRDLSDMVAVALELEQANRRLQKASERLGEVRHEERRMLRRELHDSLGPVLAGVTLGLAASRRLLGSSPAQADQLLAELEVEVASRSDAVRQLSRSLLPAELDDGDLVAALDVLARRFESPGFAVRTSSDGLGDVDTKHQVAVYYVAAEALLNSRRHSGGATVTIAVSGGDGDPVVLEVVDDGRGIPPDNPYRGVGLQSMRERADELAGAIEIGPGPEGRGTRVRLELP